MSEVVWHGKQSHLYGQDGSLIFQTHVTPCRSPPCQGHGQSDIHTHIHMSLTSQSLSLSAPHPDNLPTVLIFWPLDSAHPKPIRDWHGFALQRGTYSGVQSLWILIIISLFLKQPITVTRTSQQNKMAAIEERAWEREVREPAAIPSLHWHQIDAVQEGLHGKMFFWVYALVAITFLQEKHVPPLCLPFWQWHVIADSVICNLHLPTS